VWERAKSDRRGGHVMRPSMTQYAALLPAVRVRRRLFGPSRPGTLTTSETHPHHFPHHSGGTAGNARQRLGSEFSVFLWFGVGLKRLETGSVHLAKVDVDSSNTSSRRL
jgi:hypothetical protein